MTEKPQDDFVRPALLAAIAVAEADALERGVDRAAANACARTAITHYLTATGRLSEAREVRNTAV